MFLLSYMAHFAQASFPTLPVIVCVLGGHVQFWGAVLVGPLLSSSKVMVVILAYIRNKAKVFLFISVTTNTSSIDS
jgi:hypothetical protein